MLFAFFNARLGGLVDLLRRPALKERRLYIAYDDRLGHVLGENFKVNFMPKAR